MNTALAKTGKGPAVTVQPGESIQAAVDGALPGTVITVLPGTYHESLTVNKPGISIIGEGNVTLQNPGNATIGIVVQDAADGLTLKNVTVRGFLERGVEIKHVEGFLLSHVTAAGDGEFGFLAEYCNNGVFDHCEATGHTDTGIFVGQSTNMTVSQNETHGNVIGVETENASHIVIEKNHIYDNAAGILCLLVPGKIVSESTDITITKNQVRANNHENFSKPPEMESALPSGIGMLLVGINASLVQDNHVTDHRFTGIATISSLLLGAIAGLPPEAFTGMEPNPDGVRVVDNKVTGNGYNPPDGLPLPGVDLLWDGTGTNNCWSRNVFSTSYPSPLPACF